MNTPTPHPEVNTLLDKFLPAARAILGPQFVGMYLFGSLTSAGFDRDSDVDVLIVTEAPVSDKHFAALYALHVRLAALDLWCATQLEVSYIPRRALRRYDSTNARHPHIDRGSGAETLFWMQHDESWLVQRHVLRTRGIVLAGPAPATLIDEVAPDDLRQAMRAILKNWGAPMLDDPAPLQERGGQTYTVLSLCRILYTLRYGDVVSKSAAARWAQETLDKQWPPLIARTWDGRHNPGCAASPTDVNGTLAFIRYTLAHSAAASAQG